MDIELLVLRDCPNQDAAAELIRTAVADADVNATIRRTIIDNPDQAQRRAFTGSPTILVNGADPLAWHGAPPGLSCRLYATPDGLRGTPALADLQQALKRAAAG
ncbi:MAG: thioredoxin family protein [Mycobacteriaceae bacterium]